MYGIDKSQNETLDLNDNNRYYWTNFSVCFHTILLLFPDLCRSKMGSSITRCGNDQSQGQSSSGSGTAVTTPPSMVSPSITSAARIESFTESWVIF